MREIKLYKRAEKFLKKLPPKQQQQVARSVVLLRDDAQPPDSKKLIGYERYFRVDQGEYRIIYWWDKIIVHIVLIGKRNDSEVSKKLKKI